MCPCVRVSRCALSRRHAPSSGYDTAREKASRRVERRVEVVAVRARSNTRCALAPSLQSEG
eukprot:2771207-Pleurochrysis_carterae.AAC.1